MSTVTWTLRGRLLLDPQLPELQALADVSTRNHGSTVALPGVRVRIEGKQFDADPTGWETWGEDVTDAEGHFEIRHEKNELRRLLRVSCQFKDDRLKLYAPNDSLAKKLLELATDLAAGPFHQLATDIKEDVIEQLIEQTSRIAYDVKWLTLHDSGNKHGPGVIDFSNLTFASGRNHALGDFVARRHAEIWHLMKAAMAHIDGLGGGVGFRTDKPLALMHPHDNSALPADIQASYANPHNDVIYLVQTARRDDFDAGAILHEMMHLWAYQHSHGEERLATYLLTHFDTHTGRQTPYTACHEAMAEALSNEVYRQLFHARATVYGADHAQRRPFSRPHLRAQGMRSLADLDRFEHGWLSAFGLLLCPDVAGLDMNEGDPYANDATPGDRAVAPMRDVPVITLAELMRAIARSDGDRDDGWDRDTMYIDALLSRCEAELPHFTKDHHAAYLRILDPSETAQPIALLPSSLTSVEAPTALGRALGQGL